MTYFLSIQVGDVRTLSPRTTQHGKVWIERSIEMGSRMAHPCHGAVNKPSAMNTKPSADVHRRIPERNFRQAHLFTQKLVNTHKTAENYVETKSVQTQICSILFITSSESLVQSSDSYNRQAVYTRTSSLQGGIGACQAFSTDACCYI